MTRLRFYSNAGSGGGGGGGPGGSTVFFGPEFGETDLNAFTMHVNRPSVALGPFAHDMTLNPALDRLAVGPVESVIGMTPTGGLIVTDLFPNEDSWFNQASTAQINGAATTLQAKTASAVPGSDQQIAYIAWDLTGYTGTTITAASITLWHTTSQVTGSSVSWTFLSSASKPFEEDTANWSNSEPPSGTSRQTGSFSTSTTLASSTITLDATARANMPGNWVWLRCLSGTTLGLATESIRSKENATVANRPNLDLTVTL